MNSAPKPGAKPNSASPACKDCDYKMATPKGTDPTTVVGKGPGFNVGSPDVKPTHHFTGKTAEARQADRASANDTISPATVTHQYTGLTAKAREADRKSANNK
jgi:hypothetical protein